jgi:uncharacterized protein (TIGR00730 family)
VRIAIFTGSAVGAKDAYIDQAARLAAHLAKAGHGVVYGGGKVGLMGVVADAALAAGGEVIGVTPRTLVEREVAHHGVTRLEVVETMHERKARMVELADALVALPGGVGTLDEFFEAWTWQLLGIHDKPVALYDIDGYWQPLRGLLDQIVADRFLGQEHRAALIEATDPDALVEAIERWSPPRQKWITHADAK